jgi:hypothetical protein
MDTEVAAEESALGAVPDSQIPRRLPDKMAALSPLGCSTIDTVKMLSA